MAAVEKRYSNAKSKRKMYMKNRWDPIRLFYLAVMVVVAFTTYLEIDLIDTLQFTETHIPQKIWQTAKSYNAPRAVRIIMDTWYTKNGYTWQHGFLDDDELLEFMKKNFNSTVVQAFQDLPLSVMRADFFRLAIMYLEGGVYADVDVECKIPIRWWGNGLIDKCDVLIGLENNVHFSNWGFASRKHHPLFRKAIDLSISRFIDTSKIDIKSEDFVHYVAGPRLLTNALEQMAIDEDCLGNYNKKNSHGDVDAIYIYKRCADALKAKYNICLHDRKSQKRWFKNHYSSQKKRMQSDEWMTSWIVERKQLRYKNKQNLDNASKI